MVKFLVKTNWTVDLWDDPEKSSLVAGESESFWGKTVYFFIKAEFFLAKNILKNADNIIIGLVPDGIIEKYSLKNRRVLAVTNGINIEYPLETILKRTISDKDGLILFYCGTVDKIRLEGLFDAIKILKDGIEKIKVILVGHEEPGGYDWFNRQFDDLTPEVSIDIQGKQPYKNVVNGVLNSHICICPYPDKLDIAATYPVKIFDYMYIGRPVVASRLPGIERIIKHNEDGLLFEPGNYGEMARHIKSIYESHDMQNRLTANAKTKVLSYRWDAIHDKIFNFLETPEG